MSPTIPLHLTLDALWTEAGFTPNDAQRRAIEHVDGPLFLTAGPGSGKTRVLLWRTLNLIVFHGVKPEDIFLSTFTEKAARQLRQGLQNLLGLVSNRTGQPYDLARMYVGTVHSLCQQLLTDRRFSQAGQRQHAPALLDSLGQYFFVYRKRSWLDLLQAGGWTEDQQEEAQRAINQRLGGFDHYSRHYAATSCISLFNRFSEEQLDPASVETEDETLQALLRMYLRYQQLLSDVPGGRVDFSLLQQAAFRLITTHPDAGQVFQHVIIDEYQDTNAIQEQIFFALAQGHQNLCVVGDDDQALYRFRGATVENLVEFPARCQQHLQLPPTREDLAINYRSRQRIVGCYTDFIERIDWQKPHGQGHYRVADKQITAHSQDPGPSVATTDRRQTPEEIGSEIAAFIKRLKAEGKIEDYNQVAFLFPSLQFRGEVNTHVARFRAALEEAGIPVFAPRAGRFLEVPEVMAMYGLFLQIIGRPSHQGGASQGLQKYRDWTKACMAMGEELMQADAQLNAFVENRRGQISQSLNDYRALLRELERKGWEEDRPCQPDMLRPLAQAANLSADARKALSSRGFLNLVKLRVEQKKPMPLRYVINRATSLDWNILDLFYHLTGFRHFRELIALAETGRDEGPICNLAKLTEYLARFNESYPAVISASFLDENRFINTFFGSFTYAIFRLGESEYEDDEDPFPRGRVPFLTIHQSKGLEFPVVVLGNLNKRNREASVNEQTMRDLLQKGGEPLDRLSEFDNMRLFYVALSRAENLLVLPQWKRGQRHQAFKDYLAQNEVPLLDELDLNQVPTAAFSHEELGRAYSYTADYINYQQCPRRYMIFRKYGFVPSRSQTQLFGSLVHNTIEDLHYLLINLREKGELPDFAS